jgi:hypothetical protein
MEVSVELTPFACGGCGGVYAISEPYRQECYEKGTSWTCPYCKGDWGYSKFNRHKALTDEIAAQKRALLAEQSRLENERRYHASTRERLERTEAQRRAEKAAKTKLRKKLGCDTGAGSAGGGT